MSRTFRRKGYEVANMTWKDGTKIAGFYTETDWHYIRVQDVEGCCFKSYKTTYRKPTRQEHNKQYWRIHGDNNPNQWCPGRFYRKPTTKWNREFNKNELFKYMRNDEYECLFEDNPRSCFRMWDWR